MIVSEKPEIIQYIPQRDPIIMVDALVSIENNTVITTLSVAEGSMFTTAENTVSYYGVLEHIAQSYALVHGYLFGSDIGMIGKITKLSTFFEPKIKIPLTTTITILNNMGNLVLIEARSYQEEHLLLSCEMYLHFNSSNKS